MGPTDHNNGAKGFVIPKLAWDGSNWVTWKTCYVVIFQRPMTELLGLMVVMLEGLGFNLCVAPFLNVCVPNLPQGVKDGECWRWLEFGWRCCTRVGVVVRMKANED